MNGRIRIILLLLAITLAAGLIMPAAAEPMTLGVWVRGIRTLEDGSTVQASVEGSFRVLQGGLEAGIIQAGGKPVTLTSEGPVVLAPMPETFAAGWDLSNATTTVVWTPGNVTVPVLLPEVTEESRARLPEPTAEPAAPAKEDEQEEEQTAEPAQEPERDPVVLEAAPAPATATPEINWTPVPTAEPTPAPDVQVLTATADSGIFHIKVYYDSNNNGACSIYEKGVGGIPVYLVDAADEVVTGGETNSEGEITLPGLTPGSYRVRVSLPEKWGFSRKGKETGLNSSIMDFSSEAILDSAPISVSAGQIVECGVGLLKGVVVSGVCWLDENANGIMEKGEPRIAGAHVEMNGQKNGLKYEAYSDTDGKWTIYRLRAGFYDFIGNAPEGMMFTRYSKTGGKNRSVLTTEGKTRAARTLDLNDGYDEPDQNIGFTWQGSVSGIAFLDANYNGLYDEGEKPLPGVKMTAIKQVKDEEIAVAWSGEDGRYILNGLRGNTYTIRAVLPEDGSNFTKTVSDLQGNHFTARENRRENFWKDFTLMDGESREVNVGAIYYGSVSGTVYLDNDFSGTLSGGEKVAQGISVSLLDERGATLETKQTTAKGTYSFVGLTPGKYSLQMTAQSGYAFTRPGEGNVILNRTGGIGYSEAFEVPLGTDVTGKDAGMIRPAKVTGTVFADRNDNGIQDAGEDGLTGTMVRLMSEEGEAFSAEIREDGAFLFDAVMPGRYMLQYELPETGIFARNEAGGNTITGENGRGQGEWFELKTGDEKSAPLCGALTLGSIQGTVFADHDGSGSRESGEELLAGAIMRLTPSRSDLPEKEIMTGEDGSFRMEELHPDRYTITVTMPEGKVTSRLGGVTLPISTGMNSQQAVLPLSMGQRWTDQHIGAVQPARLAGRLWLDENNDGRMDADEQTPAGYEILITDEANGAVFQTLRTAEDGSFEMNGMVPGSFTVRFRLKDNMDAAGDGDSTFRKEGGEMQMTGIALNEGEEKADLLLGIVEYTAMGGKVWIDRGNGAESLTGARIQLQTGENETVGQTVTGEDGVWRFQGLMPGTYILRAEMPEGAVVAEPDDERLDSGLISILQETDGRKGASAPIELIMGQDQLSLNIGSVLPGTIGDYCWLDENENGFQDGGEWGIPHVKVELRRNGRTVAETETDQYGLYFFREVYPAVYTLRVTAPDEIRPTRKRTDIPLIVSSLNETEESVSETDTFSVASDSVDFNFDLGFRLRRSGIYPAGYGEQETMDWSKTYAEKSGQQD